MDSKHLPRYRGLPDDGKAWEEPDEQGRMPLMHLRDYVVLCVLVFLCFPMSVPWLLRFSMCHWNLVRQNASRDESMWSPRLPPDPANGPDWNEGRKNDQETNERVDHPGPPLLGEHFPAFADPFAEPHL